jgi:hypothetical protein
MRLCEKTATPGFFRKCLFGLIGTLGVLLSQSGVAAETFDGPSFRKGMWRFVRTFDATLHSTMKHRLVRQEATRCVDPTEAMKLTFSAATVGSCVSAKPERKDNTYVFAKRCDNMGPVRTVITVDSEDAYTEFNELIAGTVPKTDFVAAHRISDCEAEATPSRDDPSVVVQRASP